MATSGLDSLNSINVLAAATGQAAITAWGGTIGKLKFIASGANENTNGTEITASGGYSAGGPSTGTITTFWGSPSYSTGVTSVTNSGANGAVTVTNMPAVTITQAELWDNAGTPKRWWWGGLSPSVTTNSGDTVTFAASSVTCSLNI